MIAGLPISERMVSEIREALRPTEMVTVGDVWHRIRWSRDKDTIRKALLVLVSRGEVEKVRDGKPVLYRRKASGGA